MKKNNLIALLSLSTLLAVTGCDNGVTSSDKDSNVVNSENSENSKNSENSENSGNANVSEKVDVNEITNATVADVTKKVNEAKNKNEVLPVSFGVNGNVSVKVNLDELLEGSTDEDGALVIGKLLKDGISASTKIDFLGNIDLNTLEAYSKKIEELPDVEQEDELNSALTELLKNDKTRLYATIDATLSDNLAEFIKNNSELDNNFSSIRVVSNLSKDLVSNELTVGGVQLNATTENNNYAYAKSVGEAYSTISNILTKEPSEIIPDYDTNPTFTMIKELSQDAMNWHNGTISSLDLVNKFERVLLAGMPGQGASSDSNVIENEYHFSQDLKNYAAQILDFSKTIKWDSAFSVDAKVENNVATITSSVDFVKLLTNVNSLLKIALEKVNTLVSEEAASVNTKALVSTYVPVLSTAIEGITPENFVYTVTATAKDKLIVGFNEKLDAKGTVDFGKINGIVSLLSNNQVQLPDVKIPYELSSNFATSYNIGGKAHTIPDVPVFDNTNE